MNSIWYTIINPTSGNGRISKNLDHLRSLFLKFDIPVVFVLTEFKHQEEKLVQEGIVKGYTKFICVGGDGTLHHMVNGIMNQKFIKTNKIKLAVIPVGTGNDWVKTYRIPKNFERAVQIIKYENSIYQDIGLIKFISNKKSIYFNNVAGIGFDAFVVEKISSFKKLGSIAYLFGSLISFYSYKKSRLQIRSDNISEKSKIFMLSIGLCKFSGGGMQLTDYKNKIDGFFDITLIRNIKLYKILLHLPKLYNGKIDDLKEVSTFHEKSLKIISKDTKYPFIQADGELLGIGDIELDLIPNAIKFIIPQQ